MIKFVAFYILVLLILLYFVSGLMEGEYGPFKVTIRDFHMCTGPKRKDCSKYTGRIVNETTMIFDVNVLEDMANIEGKIMASLDKKSQWRLPMKKLCDHIFWRPLFEKFIFYNNCIVKKGKYRMDINVQDIARKYHGKSFFYGNWSVKAMYYNNVCNFACSITEFAFVPK